MYANVIGNTRVPGEGLQNGTVFAQGFECRTTPLECFHAAWWDTWTEGEGVVPRAALAAIAAALVAAAAYGSPVPVPLDSAVAAVLCQDTPSDAIATVTVATSRPDDRAVVYAVVREAADTEALAGSGVSRRASPANNQGEALPALPEAMVLLATGAACVCLVREWKRLITLPGSLYRAAHSGVRTLPRLAEAFASSRRLSVPLESTGQIEESREAALAGERPQLVFVGLLRKMSIPGVGGTDFSCLHAQSAARAA